MTTRTLGRELQVSALGLGCAPMSGLYGEGWGEDAASEAAIGRALDLGMRFLDTADAYGFGHNEMLVGRALRGRRRDAVLCSKVGLRRGVDGSDLGVCGRPDYVHRACTMSLRRLGVETIDLYYLHRVDPEVPIEETMGAMAELVREGKVRFLGLSEAAPTTIRRAHRVHPLAAVESEYSLWWRMPEAEVLPLCRELGIGFVPYSPLGRGMLTGTVRPGQTFDAGDFRHKIPRFQPENLERNLNWVAKLDAISKERGCTTSQLALAWLLAQGRDIVPIPGTRSARHIEENAAAAGIEFTQEQAAAIAAAVPVSEVAGDRYTAELARLVGR